MGRSTQAGTRAASSERAIPKKASPKRAAPKKAAPKKTAPKKAAPKEAAPKEAAPKKAIPKKAPVALAPGQIAETKPGPVTTESLDLAPAWATKPPDASGSLPVPDAKKKSLSTALGPLDRRFAILSKVGMSATRSRAGTWGLDRQLSADDGGGRDVRRVLDVLAAQELPLISLELWYPENIGARTGTSAGLAALVTEVLGSSTSRHLERLRIVTSVPMDASVARALVDVMPLLSGLAELDLRGRGGSVLEVLRAAPALASLSLVGVGVGASELAELARAPRLAGLSGLTLEHVEADAEGIHELLASKPSLERLALSPKLLLPMDYRAVASLERLRELRLRFPDEATMVALAHAPFVPRLTRLELRDATIDLATAKRLAAHALPVLERLDLKSCEISEAALRVLVDAAPALTTLGIPSNTRPQTWAQRGRTVL